MDEPELVPATPERWGTLEGLFRSCGDARHCWCGYWYLSNRDYKSGWGGGNREYLRALVESGAEPGVLALDGDRAVGWCGVAPRERQSRLARSRILAPVDDAPVWSLTCFVVARDWRRRGLMRRLIEGALAHARERGARIVEAYPVDPQRRMSSSELYTGTLAAFLDREFGEVARRSPSRPIVRRPVEGRG